MNFEVVRDRSTKEVLAVVYYWMTSPIPGVRFHTQPEWPLQLATICHPKGYKVEAHVHRPPRRVIEGTAEVLFIRSGSARIEFYGGETDDLSIRIVRGGDIVLLLSGGHSLEMLEDTDILEVKQGPYLDDKVMLGEERHGTVPGT